MKNLAIIIPSYKCKECLEELVIRIFAAIKNIELNCNIVFIDDGSPDNSWQKIKVLKEKYSNIIGIKLSRNFGQHTAITAGLDLVEAEYYIVMDCDLQHDPKYIPILFKKILNEKKQIIFTYGKRKHSKVKLIFSKLFYYFVNVFMRDRDNIVSHELQNYVIFSQKVKKKLDEFRFRNRHLLFLLRSLGFEKDYLEVDHKERFAGKSSYNFMSLTLLAISGFFIDIKKFSQAIVILGFFLFSAFIFLGIYLLAMFFINGFLPGWLSIVFSILLLSSLICLVGGLLLLGQSQILDEVRSRPLYIYDEFLD